MTMTILRTSLGLFTTARFPAIQHVTAAAATFGQRTCGLATAASGPTTANASSPGADIEPGTLSPSGPTNNSVLAAAVVATAPRTNWTKDEVAAIYHTPLMELVYNAASVHRRFHDPSKVQMCTLMNIKTGGCSEDCSYCSQSSRHSTGLKATRMSSVAEVEAAARIAKANGSSRFCMGAAWRDMRGRRTSLRNIVAMVQAVQALGMESCVTLGMIDKTQAQTLKEAGLTAYNHNVDTSREHYPSVVTTRSYDERLQTIDAVRAAGINVCTGGILGLGEMAHDRIGLIWTCATMPSHPESFPVNVLVPIKGTPLGDMKEEERRINFDDVVRTVATARICMPQAIVRLAAGRISLPEEKQMLCFMAGANAVFTGERMLTTNCSSWEEDKAMFAKWGLQPMESKVKCSEERSPEPAVVQNEPAIV